jgi:hypothetical protein
MCLLARYSPDANLQLMLVQSLLPNIAKSKAGVFGKQNIDWACHTVKSPGGVPELEHAEKSLMIDRVQMGQY